jgi:hypothetical protein
MVFVQSVDAKWRSVAGKCMETGASEIYVRLESMQEFYYVRLQSMQKFYYVRFQFNSIRILLSQWSDLT